MARKIIPTPGEGIQFVYEDDTSGGSLVQIKESVATYNDLPTSGNTENDLRIARDTDKMYTWTIASASGDLSDWLDIGQSLSLDWSAITGGPTATPSEIDDAVADSHTHTNKALLDTYDQTNANISDSVSKKHTQNTDIGTNSQTFAIENDVKIKNESGTLSSRNNADNAYADMKVKDSVVTGEFGDETNRADPNTVLTSSLEYVIDGGGSEIETGIVGDLQVPFDCDILEVVLLADQSGNIKVDIWKDAYANFPPTNEDTITGGNEPEIADSGGGVKYQDNTLTSWTTSISNGDILRFNVDSVTTIERCIVVLKVRKK